VYDCLCPNATLAVSVFFTVCVQMLPKTGCMFPLVCLCLDVQFNSIHRSFPYRKCVANETFIGKMVILFPDIEHIKPTLLFTN